MNVDTLRSMLGDIYKKYKDIIVTEEDYTDVPMLSLGPASLDRLFQYRGIPRGHFIQITGRPSHGKTTLALDMCRAIHEQDPQALVAYFDLEGTFSPSYAAVCGVHVDRVLLVRPSVAEEALDMAEKLIDRGVPLIVLDSVSVLIPREEASKDFDDRPKVAGSALLVTRFCQRNLIRAVRNRSTVVLVNQLRKNFNPLARETEVPFGGLALQHASYLTLRLHVSETTPTHTLVTASVYKTKTAAIAGSATIPIRKYAGIDHDLDVFLLALQAGIIQQNGSWFTYRGHKVQGRDAALLEFRRSDLLADLHQHDLS
jgi:protein RecA